MTVYKSAYVSDELINMRNFLTGIQIIKVLQTDGKINTQKKSLTDKTLAQNL